jgi:small subunit ribosomal protein S4
MPGRNEDAACRRCRREKTKLFLKGERCLTVKCAVDRREYPPGEHGHRQRLKVSDYAVRLREKQKVRHMYGLAEEQFRRLFHQAERETGVTGEALLSLLERRLDNVVYRLGFAASRQAARQLVCHRHFTVNGHVTNVPSFQVSPGDAIRLRERSRKVPAVLESLERQEQRGRVPWLSYDASQFTGSMTGLPDRETIPVPIQEQLIVELYSK